MLALQGILSSCLFHTLTRDLVKCVDITGNPPKLFVSYLHERSCNICWHYRESSQVVVCHSLTRDLVKCVWHYRGIHSSSLFHTLTRDIVKCVGIAGNPLKLFISYFNERSCKNMLAIQGIQSSCLFHNLTRDLVKCVDITGNPLNLSTSYLKREIL